MHRWLSLPKTKYVPVPCGGRPTSLGFFYCERLCLRYSNDPTRLRHSAPKINCSPLAGASRFGWNLRQGQDVHNFLVNFERRWTSVQLDLPTRNNHSFEVSVTTAAKGEFVMSFDLESISRRAMLAATGVN